MSIQEHLNKIRNAVYGHEVRESIAKGIETAYDDASENGNANMEVKVARGTHPNLRSRLEEVDNKQQQNTAQLKQTEQVLNGRVDNIIGLPEGATTNDARVEDIKVGADGTVYPSPGTAVRKQVEQFDEKLSSVATFPDNIFNPYNFSWKFANLISSSSVGVGGSTNRTLCIPIEPNNTYIVKKKVATSTMILAVVNADNVESVVNGMPYLVREPFSTATVPDVHEARIVAPETGNMLLIWFWGSEDASSLDWQTVIDSVSVYKNTDTVKFIMDTVGDNTVTYEKLSPEMKTGVTIKCGSTREFKTIRSAVDYATQFPNSKIYIDPEEFNIIDEFGSNYFTNYTYTGIQDGGIILKNGVHLIFAPGSKVVCHYTGDNYNVMFYFSPFMVGPGGFTLENAEIDVRRVRYCVHDDIGTSVFVFTRTHYINCRMFIDNNLNTAREQYECIGGGMPISGEVIIEGCIFESTVMTRTSNATISTGGVSYHQNGHSTAQSRMYVRDCIFINERDRFACSTLGNSTKISTVIVSNCVSPTILPMLGKNGPVDNVVLYAINNILVS